MAEVEGASAEVEGASAEAERAAAEADGAAAESGASRGESPAPSRKGPLLRLAAVALILVGGFLIVRLTPAGEYLTREGVGAAVEELRGNRWAPAIFVALYATATAMAVPGTILTLVGGAVFGFYWGTLYNAVAANIGANAAFGVARGLGRDAVRRLAGADSKALARLDDVVGRHGFQGLLTLRLIPLVPFNVLNFGSGLLPMKWSTYALATAIGILPGTAVYTFFAESLLQGAQGADREALTRLLVAGGLLAALSFLPAILKRLGARLPGMGTLAVLATAVGAIATAPATATTTPGAGGSAAAVQEATADPAPTATSDQERRADLPAHDAFTQVLVGVVRNGDVDYRALAKDYEEPTGLAGYLEQLEATTPAALEVAPAVDQLAFWINAYNACMLKRVIEHYPIQPAGGFRGLRNRAAGRPANSVWQIEDVFTEPHCAVAGALRSQDEIEHEIIRPMGDPRIHFAVNCAAKSCPPLVAQAYDGASLDRQLDERVAAFMADAAHFAVIVAGADGRPVVRTNRVLEWFKDDFGGEAGVLSFLAGYASGATREALERPDPRLAFFDYDWTLNDISVDISR